MGLCRLRRREQLGARAAELGFGAVVAWARKSGVLTACSTPHNYSTQNHTNHIWRGPSLDCLIGLHSPSLSQGHFGRALRRATD